MKALYPLHSQYRDLTAKISALLVKHIEPDVVSNIISQPIKSDPLKRTYLHLITFLEYEETLQNLSTRNIIFNVSSDVKDANNFTPLDIACLQGFHGIAKILIRNGAKMNDYNYLELNKYLDDLLFMYDSLRIDVFSLTRDISDIKTSGARKNCVRIKSEYNKLNYIVNRWVNTT